MVKTSNVHSRTKAPFISCLKHDGCCISLMSDTEALNVTDVMNHPPTLNLVKADVGNLDTHSMRIDKFRNHLTETNMYI